MAAAHRIMMRRRVLRGTNSNALSHAMLQTQHVGFNPDIILGPFWRKKIIVNGDFRKPYVIFAVRTMTIAELAHELGVPNTFRRADDEFETSIISGSTPISLLPDTLTLTLPVASLASASVMGGRRRHMMVSGPTRARNWISDGEEHDDHIRLVLPPDSKHFSIVELWGARDDGTPWVRYMLVRKGAVTPFDILQRLGLPMPAHEDYDSSLHQKLPRVRAFSMRYNAKQKLSFLQVKPPLVVKLEPDTPDDRWLILDVPGVGSSRETLLVKSGVQVWELVVILRGTDVTGFYVGDTQCAPDWTLQEVQALTPGAVVISLDYRPRPGLHTPQLYRPITAKYGRCYLATNAIVLDVVAAGERNKWLCNMGLSLDHIADEMGLRGGHWQRLSSSTRASPLDSTAALADNPPEDNMALEYVQDDIGRLGGASRVRRTKATARDRATRSRRTAAAARRSSRDARVRK